MTFLQHTQDFYLYPTLSLYTTLIPLHDAIHLRDIDPLLFWTTLSEHAPTLSFPVHGTLMIEPTESEGLAELKRFIETMQCIYNEINEIEIGKYDKNDNVLVQSPHPEYELTADEWSHSYPRSKAAYPLTWITENKFQIPVGRVDNAFGDRNLQCSCPKW